MSYSTSSSPPPLDKASFDYDHSNYLKSLPPSPPPSSKRSASSRTSSKSSRDKSRNIAPTAKELMRMLVDEQETTRDLEQQLTLNTSQLVYEQDRADTAERKLRDVVLRFKEANDARVSAEADTARLREELKLYKVALEEAQKEILKAQDILRDIEGRKREAEEDAAQLRRKLRKINEERMVETAREEGRKQGLQEGLEMGKDIGYLRGRNQGYINGRSTAERVMERYFSPPSESEVRRSRGEPDLPPESDPPYTATTTRFPPSGGSVTSSSSSSSEREEPRYYQTGGTRTASARTTLYSPAQGRVEIPPDGFIPEVDASMVIRLPPPHELVRPPPTPVVQSVSSRPSSPSPHVPPVPVPGDVPVLMVPEPRSPGNPLYDLSSERPHRKVRRKSSGESVGSSTRTSELDILNAPEHGGNRGHRSSGLSVIPEVASFQEASTPSSRSMKQQGEDRVDEAGFVHVSMPAPLTAAEMASLKARSTSQSLSVDQGSYSRPGSTSSFGTVNITIQPPSRPASNNSASTGSGTRPHLLSPADADRPVPLPRHTPTSDRPETIVMDLPDGGLPPGFVPTGPATLMMGTETNYTGAGVPLPPSTVGSYHNRLPSQGYGGSVRGEMETPVVIPPPSGRSGQETDSSESSDADTLTTPPRRYRVPSSVGYSATGIALPSSAGTPYSYVRSVGSAGVTPAALGRVKSFSTDRGGPEM